MNLLALDPPFEEDFLSTSTFLSKPKLIDERISFVKNGGPKLQKLINSITVNHKQGQTIVQDECEIIAELQQILSTSSALVDDLYQEVQHLQVKLDNILEGDLKMNQQALDKEQLDNLNIRPIQDGTKPILDSKNKVNFDFDTASKMSQQDTIMNTDQQVKTHNIFQQSLDNIQTSEMIQNEKPQSYNQYIKHDLKEYEDLDDYLRELQSELQDNNKVKEELEEVDYDIWFAKKSKNYDGRTNFQQAKKDQQVTNSLYIKNIDKKAKRKDFINLLLPFFEDSQTKLDVEVEVIIMQKGKMRGQGFMNFKEISKTVEIYDALQGIVIGQKPIQMEFSASGNNKRVKKDSN
eukprot:403349075